jgi:hypothetical protein
MSVLEIPLRSDVDNYDFSVDLEGITYIFELAWNDRSSLWSLIISDAERNVILGAIPIMVNANLLERFKMQNLPPGTLALLDLSGSGLEAGKTDIGSRCIMIYEESEG